MNRDCNSLLAAVQVNALLLQSLLISMRNLDKYTVQHASRKWFSENWGPGRFLHGYPVHNTATCQHTSHSKELRRCEVWKVIAVKDW